MKKISLLLTAVILCITICGCGGASPTPTPEPTIAPSPVPYNENDIVVSFNGNITTDPFGTPQIPIAITNNGEYGYSVTIDSISVNGITEVETSTGVTPLNDNALVLETVEPGETIETNIVFLAGIWKYVGLTAEEISTVEISFKVIDQVNYNNYTEVITKEF